MVLFVMQTVGLFGLDLCFWSLFCLPGTLWVHSNSEEFPNCSMVCVCGLCMWFHGYYFCCWSSSGGMKYDVLCIWLSGGTGLVAILYLHFNVV